MDDILAAEKHHLNNIKKVLELTCKNVSDQMQVISISFLSSFESTILSDAETR